MRDPLVVALSYAAAGIPVFPLHTPTPRGCSCRRNTCDRAGKHPRWHRRLLPAGLHNASTDSDTVRSWWDRWPEANIGLRTGILCDVADIDGPDGLPALRDILHQHPSAPPIVRTGSGGWHLYFAATGYGNRVRFLPHTDWRGAGGYVVAPPSRHASGHLYQWTRSWTDLPPRCPDPLLDLLKQSERVPSPPSTVAVRSPDRYAAAALRSEAARVAQAPRGERNHRLFRAAASLGELIAGGSLSESDSRQSLTAAAAAAGLSPMEIERTIRSGFRAGARNPRRRQEG